MSQFFASGGQSIGPFPSPGDVPDPFTTVAKISFLVSHSTCGILVDSHGNFKRRMQVLPLFLFYQQIFFFFFCSALGLQDFRSLTRN